MAEKKGIDYFTDVLKNDTLERVRRSLGLEAFIAVGQALVKSSPEVYLTAHRPGMTLNTSYRLWSAKPKISESGHPDWTENGNLGIAEFWKLVLRDEEEEYIVREISKGVDASSPRPEIKMSNGWFCQETRLYTIKSSQ